jgi:hypothetical protein
MKFEKARNENYVATIVKLKDFVLIPKAERIQSALIFGNSVIVSKEVKAGDIGIFFPVETQLSNEFVSANNLYRHAEWGNIDSTKTGYLEQHRRIKCAKFLGVKSEGIWLPLESLNYLGVNLNEFTLGLTFDRVGDKEICQKYIVGTRGTGGPNNCKASKLKDSIVDGQFRFHQDTENLRKNIDKVFPTDYISISDKWHGTSAIISKPLVIIKPTWLEKIASKLGVRVKDSEYKLTYSSRRVIKGTDGTFGTDLWGIVAKEVSDKIPTSFSIYGEIVGYTPEGKIIQAAAGGRAYHYGCAKGEHKFVVYRVVTTNSEGKTLELSWPQMKEFCNKYGLEMVHEWFYGPVFELFPIETNFYMTIVDERERLELWQNNLLKFLVLEYTNDGMCQFNNNEVPAEGIVVRRDSLEICDSWKLKNFLFLTDETKKNDAGVLDMETVESNDI